MPVKRLVIMGHAVRVAVVVAAASIASAAAFVNPIGRISSARPSAASAVVSAPELQAKRCVIGFGRTDVKTSMLLTRCRAVACCLYAKTLC